MEASGSTERSGIPREGTLRWLPFWAAFAAALVLRLVLLDLRPLHHDEGVNAWIASRPLSGFGIFYDPANFHGPFLFFLVLPILALVGESDFLLRLPAALASAAMVPLLLPLRRRLGLPGITAAAWLLALSPSFVSYGRDLIHETFLVVLTLALVGVAVAWRDGPGDRKDQRLILAAFCLSLLGTVKETWVLTVVVFGIAAVLAHLWARHRWPDVRGIWGPPSKRTLGRAAAAFAAPWVVLYTSFFTNPRGLLDSVRTYFLWAGRGVEGAGHAKPWHYFPGILLSFETVTVVCAVAGAALALRRRDAFGTFCALWAAGELAAYSLLRYKTPWLVLNIALPAVLTAAVLFREAWRWERPWRLALAFLFALGLGWSGWRAVEVSFLRFDDTRLALVYVPTSRDVTALVAQVKAAAALIPPGRRPIFRILGRYSWPLPWYLHGLTGLQYGHDVPAKPDGDILIVDQDLEAKLRPLLTDRYSSMEYLLRPGKKVVVFVREEN